MTASTIEWTDEVWNPVTGCSRVSPGCAHCYALELAPRLRRFAEGRERKGKPGGKWLTVRDGGRGSGPAFGVTLHPDVLGEPLQWRKSRRVFVNSMSDLFHEEISDEFIAEVFAVMAIASQHTFQVLTKRPERMRDLLKSWRFCKLTMAAILRHDERWGPNLFILADDINEQGFGTLHNVWLGVSIENRRFVHRADLLRATPAAVRFISAEPLLGPLIYDNAIMEPSTGGWNPCWHDDRLEGGQEYPSSSPELDLTGIDWLIVGGESGHGARPMRPEWVRDLRDACIQPWHEDEHGNLRGTAFFFKQWGGRTPKAGGRELDGRTWDEMPAVAA